MADVTKELGKQAGKLDALIAKLEAEPKRLRENAAKIEKDIEQAKQARAQIKVPAIAPRQTARRTAKRGR